MTISTSSSGRRAVWLTLALTVMSATAVLLWTWIDRSENRDQRMAHAATEAGETKNSLLANLETNFYLATWGRTRSKAK